MKKAMIYVLLLMPLTVWAAKSDLKPRLVVCTSASSPTAAASSLSSGN